MATYYIDFEGGNDSNDGLSFANRKKSFKSADTAAGSGGPHEFRIMASPVPTDIGTGYVTARPSCDYYDTIYTNGSYSDVYPSTTEGQTRIYLQDHGLVTGDTVGIYPQSSSTSTWPDSGNLFGVWEITRVDDDNFTVDGYTSTISSQENSKYAYIFCLTQQRILLDTAVTESIACHGDKSRGAWTASANVTTSLSGQASAYNQYQYSMEGYWGDYINISSSFGTGKAAYWTLPSTLDLSGYQQISFYWRWNSGSTETSSSNGYTNYSLRLCSDTSGDTTVNTFNIPIIGGYTASYGFRPITIDLGTNLGSSIQSIALYVDTDKGAQSFYLSNVIACKAKSDDASLTLNSLIGLNTTASATGGMPGNREWYAIESIVGRRILLNSVSPRRTKSAYNYNGGLFAWHGDNEGTRDIYKRECIPIDIARTSSSYSSSGTDSPFYVAYGGSSSGERVISGGWNRTDMSTQLGDEIGDDGMSYFDGGNFVDWSILCASRDYMFFKNLGFVRWRQARIGQALNSLKLENLDMIYSAGNFYLYNCNVPRFRGIRINVHTTSSGALYASRAAIYDTQGSFQVIANTSTYATSLYSGSCFIIDRVHVVGGYYSGGYLYSSGIAVNKINSFTNHPGEGGMNNSQRSFSTLSRGAQNWGYSTGDMRSTINDTVHEDLGTAPMLSPGLRIGIATCVNSNRCIEYGSVDNGIDEFQELYHKTTDGTKGYKPYFKRYDAQRYTFYGYSSQGESMIKVHKGEGFNTYIYQNDHLFLNDFDFSDSSPFTLYDFTGFICSRDHDGVSGSIFNRVGGCEIIPDSTTRHTASGISWKMTRKSKYSTKFKIASIPATANSQITLKLWFYRSSSSSPVGRLEIVKSDTGTTTSYSSNTSSNGSWEELSVSTTPSYDSIVDCYVFLDNSSASNNQSIYIDDFSIS